MTIDDFKERQRKLIQEFCIANCCTVSSIHFDVSSIEEYDAPAQIIDIENLTISTK